MIIMARRKAYNPKPMDPGQPVKWAVRVPGYWTIPAHYDESTGVYTPHGGEWIEPVTHIRTGEIIDHATSPSAWWVVPDDDPANPVVIRRHGKKFSFEWHEGDLFQSPENSDWRICIRRAENLRRRGILFAAVVETRPGHYWHGIGTWRDEEKVLCWHADYGCPDAAGLEHDDGTGFSYNRGPEGGWTIDLAVDVIIGRNISWSNAKFCPKCIMLHEPYEPVAWRCVTCGYMSTARGHQIECG